LYKTIDYRIKKINNFSKTMSVLEKEILFKKFLFKMERLLYFLEESKSFYSNQLIINNLLSSLNTSLLYNSLEPKLFEKKFINSNLVPVIYKNILNSNLAPVIYKNTLNVRGGYFNKIISKSLNSLIFSFNFLINDNSNRNNFKKIYKYKKFFKWTIICCTIFLIFYLNKNKIQKLLFLFKSKLQFIKIFFKKKKKFLFKNLKKTSRRDISQKVKLLKKIKFKPLEIFTGQKKKLEGKKTLKYIYERIPKNSIKSFFKKLSNTIDGALKVKIKFKPFKKDGSSEELDFNTTITKLFDLLSEDV